MWSRSRRLLVEVANEPSVHRIDTAAVLRGVRVRAFRAEMQDCVFGRFGFHHLDDALGIDPGAFSRRGKLDLGGSRRTSGATEKLRPTGLPGVG